MSYFAGNINYSQYANDFDWFPRVAWYMLFLLEYLLYRKLSLFTFFLSVSLFFKFYRHMLLLSSFARVTSSTTLLPIFPAALPSYALSDAVENNSVLLDYFLHSWKIHSLSSKDLFDSFLWLKRYIPVLYKFQQTIFYVCIAFEMGMLPKNNRKFKKYLYCRYFIYFHLDHDMIDNAPGFHIHRVIKYALAADSPIGGVVFHIVFFHLSLYISDYTYFC